MIIDFQFGEVGLGCLDLAHLTRKLPPQLITYDFCQKLIKNYHKSLKVNGYTYKECYLDYQKCIAAMVLNPIWQFHVLGIPPEICIQSLLEIINIYDFMNCQQLYKNHCLSSKKFVNNLYSEDNKQLSSVRTYPPYFILIVQYFPVYAKFQTSYPQPFTSYCKKYLKFSQIPSVFDNLIVFIYRTP